VNIEALEQIWFQLELVAARFDEGEGSLAALLHNFANLSGHLQAAFAFQHGNFDGHNFAAVLCPGEGGGNANIIF